MKKFFSIIAATVCAVMLFSVSAQCACPALDLITKICENKENCGLCEVNDIITAVKDKDIDSNGILQKLSSVIGKIKDTAKTAEIIPQEAPVPKEDETVRKEENGIDLSAMLRRLIGKIGEKTAEENKESENIPEKLPENQPENQKEDMSGSENSDYILRVVALVNEQRRAHGLDPVTYDDASLMRAAGIRAAETEKVFSHTRPNGTRCFTVLDECSVSYMGAGENIAMGQRTPEEVMNGWMNSEGHRANILNGSFKKIGVGCHKGSDGRLYWSQMFIY